MTERTLRVLMIAYGCSPKRAGEHLLGWEWAARLARRNKVSVLTSAHHFRDSEGRCPPGLSVLPVDDRRFAFLRRLGLMGPQLYYQLWVRAAARQARAMVAREHFDIVHQCTFHTYRWPFLPALWGDVASVWGPVAGLEHIPWRFLPSLGWRGYIEVLRFVADAVYKRRAVIRNCLKAADCVIVSNEVMRNELSRLVERDYEFIPANAVDLPEEEAYVAPPKGALDIVAVGALVAMRPYGLVLKAIASIEPGLRAGLTLTFIGSGRTESELKALARKLGLDSTVAFLGQQPRDVALARMRTAHLMVFPSLRDSGSSSIAEAMAMGLPVLGFDFAGSGALLVKGGGLAVSARTPDSAVAQLAVHIRRLLDDPAELLEISEKERAAAAHMFAWSGRISRLEEIYRSAVECKLRAARAAELVPDGRCLQQEGPA